MLRKGAVLVAALAAAWTHAQFERQGVRLLSHIPVAALPGPPTYAAGSTGYVSPSGREYAIVTLSNGEAVVEITNPQSPTILGRIPGVAAAAREVVTMGQYAYATADVSGYGMHIIDLSLVDLGIISLAATYRGNSFCRAHTLQANPASQSIFLNATNIGRFVALDCSNPIAPVQTGTWTTFLVHDSQVVTFTSGPYAGREIAFLCCTSNDLYIVDVTNRSNMVTLGNSAYLAGSNYCHSGQLTADGRYFLINDEFDESNSLVPSCATHIVDVTNLANPQARGYFANGGSYVDHNSHLVGDFLYLGAYEGGLRVYDVSNPLAIVELGFFDTYPAGNAYSFNGAWGAFAGLPSGNVIVSDRQNGLFILDPSEALGEGAPLIGAQVIAGQHMAGGLRELRKEDGLEFAGLWMENPKFEDTPVVSILVEAESNFSPAKQLDLFVKVRIDGATTGLGAVKALNRVTNKFDLLGTFGVATSPASWSTNGLSGPTYVSPTGRMLLELDVYPGIEAEVGAYSVFVDQVKFTVHRT